VTLRLNLWCGPRNVSTALMYSFRQRPDTRVVDEPLYGHYLAYSDAVHPGAEAVVASMSTDIDEVLRTVVLGPVDRPVVVFKQMAHHLIPSVPLAFLDRCANVLVIRDPTEVLTTIVRQLPEPTMRDIGIARQVELFDELVRRGQDPAVVDARFLLEDPASVLAQLCERLGLSWDPAMLSWPAGPKPEDGVWAEHWYQNAHESTGFVTYAPKTEPVPAHVRDLAAEASDLYQRLVGRALRGAS
jgi:hypothetical protein